MPPALPPVPPHSVSVSFVGGEDGTDVPVSASGAAGGRPPQAGRRYRSTGGGGAGCDGRRYLGDAVGLLGPQWSESGREECLLFEVVVVVVVTLLVCDGSERGFCAVSY